MGSAVWKTLTVLTSSYLLIQRFAIETLLLGVEAKTSKMSAKSIDDEYAPAAFVTEKIEWLKNSATNEDILTFLNWRAVSCLTYCKPNLLVLISINYCSRSATHPRIIVVAR